MIREKKNTHVNTATLKRPLTFGLSLGVTSSCRQPIDLTGRLTARCFTGVIYTFYLPAYCVLSTGPVTWNRRRFVRYFSRARNISQQGLHFFRAYF